jgi:cystathionine beta-lyase
VWSKHELESLAAICLQNNVVILSDEIHGDLIRRGENFVPFASVAPEMAHLSLTCSAPTKTFNLAGLSSAFVIASDPSIRTKISTMFRHLGHDLPNVMSLAAAEAAYASGEAWLEALLDYLTATFEWFENEVSNRFPSIGLSRIEGTYLAWLDIRGMIADLGVNETRVQRTLLRETGLWLSAGTPFGSAGYLRMNLGCPRPTVEDGLDRLHRGLDLLR